MHVGEAVAGGAAAFGAFAAAHPCAEADLFGEDSDVAVGGVDQFPGSDRREAERDQVVSMTRERLLGGRVRADGFLVHGGWVPRAGFARGAADVPTHGKPRCNARRLSARAGSRRAGEPTEQVPLGLRRCAALPVFQGRACQNESSPRSRAALGRRGDAGHELSGKGGYMGCTLAGITLLARWV